MTMKTDDTMSNATALWRERIAIGIERTEGQIRCISERLSHIPTRDETKEIVAIGITNHVEICKAIRKGNEKGLLGVRGVAKMVKPIVCVGLFLGSLVAGILAGLLGSSIL